MSIKDLLRDARLPEKTIELCLRGDLAGEYETLQVQLERERERRRDSLGGNPTAQAITGQMEGLREQMAAATVTFRFRALPRREFQAMFDKHPPRRVGDDVDQRDERAGFNRETLFYELIPVCAVEPELDAEDWTMLLDEKLNDGQFMELALTALALNRREVDVPFSLADSPPTPG